MAIHFGIKPAKGGKPPKERSIKEITKIVEGLKFDDEEKFFNEVILKTQK